MELILIYLLKANLVFLLLYAPYRWVIKSQLLFQLNRLVHLSIIASVIALPLIPAKPLAWTERVITGISKVKEDVNPMRQLYSKIVAAKQKSLAEMPYISNSNHHLLSTYNLMNAAVLLYLSVCLILMARFFSELVRVVQFIRASKIKTEYGMEYYDAQHSSTPFSFFNYMVISRSRYDQEEFRQVYFHEKAHRDQWHSIDVLLVEFLGIILWCNPLIKSFKKATRLNLEFLADQAVLTRGFNRNEYQRNIIRHYFKGSSESLVNTFRSAPGQRIDIMDSKAKEYLFTETGSYKYYSILPLIVGVYFFINPVVTGNAGTESNTLTPELLKFKGIYELVSEKNVYVQILERGGHLVMKTLWNDKEIALSKQSAKDFLSEALTLPVHFTINFDNSATHMRTFRNDNWVRVGSAKHPKRTSEMVALGNHIYTATVDPWSGAKYYKLPQQ